MTATTATATAAAAVSTASLLLIIFSTAGSSFHLRPPHRIPTKGHHRHDRTVKTTARRSTLDGIDQKQQQQAAAEPRAAAAAAALSKLDEYRGANKWKGLIPAADEPRVWDEGFRGFLLKYGMINHVVYDVFVGGDDEDADGDGLYGSSRFKDNLERFSQKGLKFSYVNRRRERKTEYDFTGEYNVVGNMICSPRSFFTAEDNWFGFLMLSKDLKELVIVFRGTKTTKEWVENATVTMQQLDGEPREAFFDMFYNRQDLMVHAGYQSLYVQEPLEGHETPKETIYRLIEKHKSTLEKVTIVGHSLGGAMAQLCSVDLAHSNVLGDIPIVCLAWASPKIGNKYLSDWVRERPNLRILRISGTTDLVPKLPPNWLWIFLNGGYHHIGTEIALNNKHLHEKGLVKASEIGANHNLQMYLHNIDPTRDVALMNKVGDVIPDDYSYKHNISPSWHSLSWPRTIYKD